ncbi:diol dehydratase reactivase subunit alpha [Aneurinibacillus danicus]|uniref:Diol dehydratase reactivase subunit alpha n=1 Tax=Aneurinibacillus danicus TaxID=267746 RepID=A0A511VCB8_9BACL|nr:diol dehydratase reactivase subunit alpha [Aneurinibacillus danicus]GEN36550.1 diol dehydratase reactivase subunit alpha [Aneurinibacillus danicus]
MPELIAGVDIGNSSTEVALARVDGGRAEFLAQHLTKTTGVKGTVDNVSGIRLALKKAVEKAGVSLENISRIRVNDAVPVIGDLAMDVISETLITESSMIGHNPDTPGGAGLAIGITISLGMLASDTEAGQAYIVVIPQEADYEWAAYKMNQACERGIEIVGAIAQKDDGVLIYNRLRHKIPIVDEVASIEKVPLGKQAAVEVALPGYVIRTLSNPYGLSTVFGLTPEETRQIAPIARALVGNRSAVVIRTPQGEIVERRIEAGRLTLYGRKNNVSVAVNDGAEAIMQSVEKTGGLLDVQGEMGTNVGGMLNGLRQHLSDSAGQPFSDITIGDLLATDASLPVSIGGAMAGELSVESGVAMASMVRTERMPVEKVAQALEEELGISVEVGGIEAEMAIRGALTTPGTEAPLVILDMGGGSTDAAAVNERGEISSVHLAGAGDMVTMLIDAELALGDRELAERVKKHPLGKVVSLFHMQLEDGTMLFSGSPFPPDVYGRVVIREEGGLTPLPANLSMEKVREIRRSAKRRVFVTNALRALKQIVPTQNIRHLSFVVMVGGSALDFEIPQMVTEELGKYGIVAGFANVRGTEGPRNAVATGLVLTAAREVTL